MSFKLSTKRREVKWPVKVSAPDEHRAGKFKIQTFYMTFIVMPIDEFHALQENVNLTPAQHLRQFASGWDLQDENGDPYDFSDDAQVEAVLKVPFMQGPIVDSYLDCISGGAKRKNF